MEVAQEIGLDKLVSIISDNCSTMQSMYQIFEQNHPTKFGQGCASHVLNLLLKDIGKLGDIPGYSQKALNVILGFVHCLTR